MPGTLRNRQSRPLIASANYSCDGSSTEISSYNNDDQEMNNGRQVERQQTQHTQTPSSPLALAFSITIVIIIVHLVAISCFIAGFISRMKLLNTGHEECDMTYSARVFFPIETVTQHHRSAINKSYGLYKFVDRRDPRYIKLLRQKQPEQSTDRLLKRDEHCVDNGNTTIVVYVPGHWGSYDQSRSLGAHGVGLTRSNLKSNHVRQIQQQLLAKGKTIDNIEKINNFVFDVYAVDFAEQGGALHGEFLVHQSEFLASMLKQLSEDCHTDSDSEIIVVAHSMGGYVARLALLEHPELVSSGLIKNVVTLATPHSNPLYAFDKSIYDIHRRLTLALKVQQQQHAETQQRPLIVSISGGLRDEMIDPSACRVVVAAAVPKEEKYAWSSSLLRLWPLPPPSTAFRNTKDAPDSVTILSTRLIAMNKAKASVGAGAALTKEESLYYKHQQHHLLGMDHRAIVWCHQLLEEVRYILWALVMKEEENQNIGHRLSKEYFQFDNSLEYSQDMTVLKETFKRKFGFWHGSVCMESSMLYNLPYMFGLYSLIVILRLASCVYRGFATASSYFSVSTLPVVGVAVLVGWLVRPDVHWFATVILALVANSMNCFLLHLIPAGFLSHRRMKNNCMTTSTRSGSVSSGTADNEAMMKSPLQTLLNAIIKSLVGFLVLGAILLHFFLKHNDDHSDEKDAGSTIMLLVKKLDLILFVYVIATIYIMLFVWMGFYLDLDDNNKKKEQNFVSFDIQLASFIMFAVPVLVAGPLVLMSWEGVTRLSSWQVLLSMQVPVGVLSMIKIKEIEAVTIKRRRKTKKNEDSYEEAIMKDKSTALLLSRIRSALMCAIISILLYQLLSPGTGYLIPQISKTILWIDIFLSLYPVICSSRSNGSSKK